MPIDFIQRDFRGGMNLFDTPETIGENQYVKGFNIRNRTAQLTPCKDVVEDTTAPYGNKQGVFAFDNYLVLFVDGKGYYKNIVTDQPWVEIADLLLDPTVPYIYTQAVPASTENFDRKLVSATQVEGNATERTINKSVLSNDAGTPAGLVVQDGKSQPWFINPDGTARLLQTYEQWTRGSREYVPKMKMMAYVDGILFGISALDGRTIYRSVTGRPLDFVVNVTTAGEKGGDANTVAYAVTYSQITALQVFSGGKLLAATINRCFPIGLNYDRQYFNEPSFTNNESFSTGIVNQYSYIDILGDRCFVDTDGIRAFTEASADKNEGRNSIFSLGITNILQNIKQQAEETATIVFDDFALFAINTTEGNVIAVYDIKRLQWVSLDQFNIGAVKQFAIADQSENPTLYCITANKLYKLYASEDFALADVTFRSATTGVADVEILLNNVRAVWASGEEETEATAIIDVDEGSSTMEEAQDISYDESGIDNIMFNFDHEEARQGWILSPRLQWGNGAKLKIFQLKCTEDTKKVNLRQQASIYEAA